MGLDFKKEEAEAAAAPPNDVSIIPLINPIPIHLMTESPGDETYTLGTVTITKGEYAMSEKINQIIEVLNQISPKVNMQ